MKLDSFILLMLAASCFSIFLYFVTRGIVL